MREAPNTLEPFQDMPAIRAWRREPLLAGLHMVSFERPGGVKLEQECTPVLYEAMVAVFFVMSTPRVSGPGVEIAMIVAGGRWFFFFFLVKIMHKSELFVKWRRRE
jgi:hypothetical protein